MNNNTDEVGGNVDVEVLLKNGNRYSATFFTSKNIAAIMNNYQKTGECKNGMYFWSSNMIIIKKISRNNIKEAIAELLATGEFFLYF